MYQKRFILFLAAVVLVFSSAIAFAVEERLDYGLYWHGYDNDMQKFVPGENNQYYDSTRPTVIYIHGWQKGHAANGFQKADLLLDHDGVYEYTQNYWIDQGWNVGIFHWEQFADEDDVQWAEAKIWSTDGPKGMEYRLADGSYGTALLQYPDLSVAELAYKDVVAALADYTGGNLRLAGHSLGNQMVTRLGELIYENIVDGNIDEETYRIQRIALLDPAWTKNGKEWLGDSNGDGNNDWVGERCRWAIFDMIDRWTDSRDFVVEIYNTTPLANQLGVGMDANNLLRERVCGTINVRPWYYSSTQVAEKHSAAAWHYFWSMAFNPPVECTISWWQRYSTGEMGPSASTPEWRIKEMMENDSTWDQVEGRYTETPEDDWFERK